MPFGGVPILLTGNWAQLTPVVISGSDADRRAASIKSSPLMRHFHTFYLRENMRVGPGEADFARWLLDVGYGENLINGDIVNLPVQTQCASREEFIEFCYPANIMQQPIENVDLFKGHCILAPRRNTVAGINDSIRNLIPEAYAPTETLHGFDHRVRNPTGDDPTAINIAQGEIEYIHNRTPSGFSSYELKLKRGMICVVNRNYDPKAGLYNGTRVMITQIFRNLIRVRILAGYTAGQEVYIGRMKFEYGNRRSEPGIPFIRTQYPIEPGFAMTINKAQGQTLDRVCVDLTASQCFSHGMFYTAVSRVRSAASLKIMSGLRDKAVNVDMELLRGADTHLHIADQPMTQDHPPHDALRTHNNPPPEQIAANNHPDQLSSQTNTAGEPMDTSLPPIQAVNSHQSMPSSGAIEHIEVDAQPSANTAPNNSTAAPSTSRDQNNNDKNSRKWYVRL